MAGRRRVAAVAGLLAWLLLLAPASAETAQTPPDQLDPPAEGESEYPEDPSEPPPPQYSTSAYSHPSPSITLTPGRTWGDPNVGAYKASQKYTSARRASRVGWPNGSRFVVLANGRSYANSVAASALAGAVRGPLLLTRSDRLGDAARREIKRLQPRRVFVVGGVDRSVRARVARLGPAVVHVDGDNPFQTAMAAAVKSVQHDATRATVIVTSRSKWRGSLGVAALAAGRQWPVLLAARSTGRKALEKRVRTLGAKRVFVVGRRSAISDRVVSGLPRVTRIAGDNAISTVAATARRGRRLGLTHRPYIVGAGHWSDAMTWGAMVGRRKDGVVLATKGAALPATVTRWLSDIRPPGLGMVQGESGIAQIAMCQIRRGRVRSWFCAEQTLRRQGYHMPQVDGQTDRFSVFAIFAFEKVAGRSANGSFGDAEWARMITNPRHKVRRPDLPSTHVEIDLGKQLILLVENGKVRHQIHTSTGKPSTPTVRGTFTVYEKRPYYQTHNRMYWSIFFYGGYAIHGYPEIPTYPASAGCARTYNGNQDFIYPKIFIGERVATY